MTTSTERMRARRARLYAAGYRYVNGRLIGPDVPRKQRRPGTEPPHGSRARYSWSADPCRCERCRDGNALEHYEYLRRRRLTTPGVADT